MTKRAVQLADGEQVITTVRRHWLPLAIEGAIDIFVFTTVIAVVGVFGSIATNGVSSLFSGSAIPLGLFVIGLFGLLLWMHFFASWSDHWLDAWVVTNKRVIDIEQHGFFHREVSSFPLERIQDVTYNISGAVAMWLHFGDVRIQTASISDDFVMKKVPFPEDIKEHLLKVLEAKKQEDRQ